MPSQKPKGAKSAYACFAQAHRTKKMEENPLEKIVFSEFSKDCGEKWKVG